MNKNSQKDNRLVDLGQKLQAKLDEAYSLAEQFFVNKDYDTLPPFFTDNLTQEFIEALETIASNCERASTGYLNIITGLTIKAAYANIDVRYHQTQIQDQTDKPAGFGFRTVSEDFFYPWMESHEFHGAKSGWQTRTFERPKPYLLTYDENIGYIKDAFLTIYDLVEKYPSKAICALALLMLRRMELRERSKVSLAIPNIQDIIQITRFFELHFFHAYKDSKGASRLPVLALYAIYTELIKELNRYQGKSLKPLEAHSAADVRTGSIGDIEILNADNTPFEAVEVKHQLQITKATVDSSKQKIRGSRIDRYYILTTSARHEPSKEVLDEVNNVKMLLGTQMIVNGVIPTIKYYLRLLTNPSSVLSEYVKLLSEDTAIGFEHRDIWNKIATGAIGK